MKTIKLYAEIGDKIEIYPDIIATVVSITISGEEHVASYGLNWWCQGNHYSEFFSSLELKSKKNKTIGFEIEHESN